MCRSVGPLAGCMFGGWLYRGVAGCEAVEFFAGAVIGALAGIRDPLQALEGSGIGGEGVAEVHFRVTSIFFTTNVL